MIQIDNTDAEDTADTNTNAEELMDDTPMMVQMDDNDIGPQQHRMAIHDE